MKASILGGVVLGSLVVAWSYVMSFTGWYLDPDRIPLFLVAVVLQVAVLVAVLAHTRDGRGYRRQVEIGMVASAVGAVIVFVGSLALTTFLLPNYFVDLLDAQRELLAAEGIAEARIEETLAEAASSRTPGGHALAGFMGTLAVGFLGSLVLAFVLRDPEPGVQRARG